MTGPRGCRIAAAVRLRCDNRLGEDAVHIDGHSRCQHLREGAHIPGDGLGKRVQEEREHRYGRVGDRPVRYRGVV